MNFSIKRLFKRLLVGFIALYFTFGIGAGLVMKRYIPALNYSGVAVYAVTWPYFVACAQMTCNTHEKIPPQLLAYLFDLEAR